MKLKQATKYHSGQWIVGWFDTICRLEEKNDVGWATNCYVARVRQNISEESIIRLARKDELEKLKIKI